MKMLTRNGENEKVNLTRKLEKMTDEVKQLKQDLFEKKQVGTSYGSFSWNLVRTGFYIEIELILLLEYVNLTLLLYSCCNNIEEMQRIT